MFDCRIEFGGLAPAATCLRPSRGSNTNAAGAPHGAHTRIEFTTIREPLLNLSMNRLTCGPRVAKGLAVERFCAGAAEQDAQLDVGAGAPGNGQPMLALGQGRGGNLVGE